MQGNNENRDVRSGESKRTIEMADSESVADRNEPVLLYLHGDFPTGSLFPGVGSIARTCEMPEFCRTPDCRAASPACRTGRGECPRECGSLGESLRSLGWLAETVAVRVTAATESGMVTFRLGPLTQATVEPAKAAVDASEPANSNWDRDRSPYSVAAASTQDSGGPVERGESIRVRLHTENPVLRSRLLRELENETGIEVRSCRALEDLRPESQRGARPWQVLLLDKRAFDAMDRDSHDAVCALAVDHPVLLLLDGVNADLVQEILRHRFRGYLLTACATGSYARAIRAVRDGDYWLPRAILAEVLQRWIAATEHPGHTALPDGAARESFTSREQQVLSLLKRGLSNKQIASELGVMEDTVKKHLQHVYDKLGVRRRTLVLAADTGI